MRQSLVNLGLWDLNFMDYLITYLDNKKENTIILIELAILLHRVKAALWFGGWMETECLYLILSNSGIHTFLPLPVSWLVLLMWQNAHLSQYRHNFFFNWEYLEARSVLAFAGIESFLAKESIKELKKKNNSKTIYFLYSLFKRILLSLPMKSKWISIIHKSD